MRVRSSGLARLSLGVVAMPHKFPAFVVLQAVIIGVLFAFHWPMTYFVGRARMLRILSPEPSIWVCLVVT